jgi:ribonuclease HI
MNHRITLPEIGEFAACCGSVLVDGQGNEEQREEVLTGYAGATQNQMELEAPIHALKMVTGRHPPFEPSRYRKIVIKTDATYVAENFGPAAAKRVSIIWVPGKKSPRTKAVDKLAKASAKEASPRQFKPAEVRRKRTNQPIEIGSVRMDGQVMTIHIFKSE